MRSGSRMRVVAVTAAAGCLAVAAAGCGSSGSNSGGSAFGGGGSGSGAAAAAQGVNTKTKTITVGAFTAKTGQFQVYYDGTQGAIAYFDDLNTHGGIDGYKFNYVTRDDQYDPSKTPAVIRQLNEQDKIFSLVSALGTPSNAAAVSYIKQTGLPNVAPAATADTFTGFNKVIFPLVPSFGSEAQLLTGYAVNQLKKKKVAIIYEDDALGQPGDKGAKAALQAAGLKPVANIGYAANEVDFSSYASKLKSSGADAVIAWAGTPALTSLQKASKAIGYNPAWLAASFNAQPVFFSLGGLPDTYFDAWLLPVPATDPDYAAFTTALKKYQPSATGGIAALAGWEEALVFAHGVKLALASGKPLTRGSLVNALNTVKGFGNDIIHGVTYTPTSHTGVTQEGVVQAKGKTFKVVAKGLKLNPVK